MEIWKNIKGFNYSVSDYGRIKSNKTGRILKPWALRDGYLQVGLMRDGERHRLLVHRLVAEAFIGNPENKPHVNHIDLVKTNNYLNNLEWVTRSQNQIHAVKGGAITGIGESYSNEFKEFALSLEMGALEVCRLLSIPTSTFRKWRIKKSQTSN